VIDVTDHPATPKGSNSLEDLGDDELVRLVLRLLPSSSPLPPPTLIRLRLIAEGEGDRLDADVAASSNRHRGPSDGIVCEVTSCLDPEVCSASTADRAAFHDWALANPRHPLTVRFLLLHAWLQAAHFDCRFAALAEDFIDAERARLKLELRRAVDRLREERESREKESRGGVIPFPRGCPSLQTTRRPIGEVDRLRLV
jgi:hypothetical protein